MKTRNLLLSVIILVLLIGLSGLISCKGNSTTNESKLLVEVLYLNHDPVQPVLKELRSKLSQFENKIIVKWYDIGENKDIKKDKGIEYHTPIDIFINNSNIIDIHGKQVKISGFPIGYVPSFGTKGKWQ